MGNSVGEQPRGTDDKRYLAFISYRHADNKAAGRQWATWLHQAIETYEVPADLVGKPLPGGGEIPARIYPIFRDEDELPADADLGGAITRALDKSNLLIVLCSPRAVESTYVADEIDYFKKLGRSDRIIAAIIDGEPNTSWDEGKQDAGFTAADECFPLPLQFEYADGERTDKRAEPIAADFRLNAGSGKPAEGWTTPEAYRQALREDGITGADAAARVEAYEKQLHLMLLKIIAGILGVPLSDLTKRDKEYQLALERERAKKLRRWLMAVAVLAVAAIGAGVFAYFKQQEAVRNEAIAVAERDKANAMLGQVRENLEFMNYDLRQTIDDYVPTEKKADLIKRIDNLAALLNTYGSSADQREIAMALLNKISVVLASKDLDAAAALSLAHQAHAILTKLAEEEPGAFQTQRDISVSLNLMGNVLARQGRKQEAMEAYQQGLEITKNLLAQSPDKVELKRDLAVSLNKICDIHEDSERFDEALVACTEALERMKELVAINPESFQYRLGLSIDQEQIGALFVAMGKHVEASLAFSHSLKIRRSLAAEDPNNLEVNRGLALTYARIASNFDDQGGIREALVFFQMGHDVLERLRQIDAGNTIIRQDIVNSHYNIGNLYYREERLDEAVEEFKQSLDVTTALVAEDPQNLDALSLGCRAYASLGDAYNKQGHTELAVSAYRNGIALGEQHVKAAPGDNHARRDLSLSYSTVGDVLKEWGRLEEALQAYQQRLLVTQELMKRLPENATIQRDLAVSYSDLYAAYNALLDIDQAHYYAKATLTQLQSMQEAGTLEPDDERFMPTMERIVADLQEKLKDD